MSQFLGPPQFVYNASGQLIAEYTTGQMQGSGTSYLTMDHLGSTRVVTDVSGNVKARHDYLPFGEETGAGIGSRTVPMGYGAQDSTRQRFTSKERDQESGLDYFLARYYSGAQGRFASVDPGNAGSIFYDPQSWNGYAYARNNPLLFVDPDGRMYKICGPTGCGYITDQEFADERDRFRAPGTRLKFTGNSRGLYGSGDIYSQDGEWVASYQQISIDDKAKELGYEVRQRFKDPKTYLNAAVGAVLTAAELRARIRSRRSAAPAIDEYHPDAVRDRVRPPYKTNAAHDEHSPHFNPRKTPEPPDAEVVYAGAVRAGMGEWYGRNARGEIYQFFSDNAGTVHFAGKITLGQLRKKDAQVARDLGF